jgi:CheY-like chemotaxis protein
MSAPNLSTLPCPVIPTVPEPLQLRILCVDDNPDVADSLGAMLRLYGAEVAVCHSGSAAVATADWFRPDAAVLDVSMPGMDGLELAARLRAAAGDRPLLLAAVTARDGYKSFAEEADAGFDLHFTKPADPAELLDALHDFLRAK